MDKLNKGRYIKALMVGASGVFVNYFLYFPFRDRIAFDIPINFWSSPFLLHLDFFWFVGIGVSATSNYILNEWWTFKR